MLRFDARAPRARRPGHRSAPGTAHPVLVLQTMVGNAATAGLISVQRKAPELGLFQKVQHSGFAADAAAIWRTDKDKTLKEYTDLLLAKVNDRLVANKVPPVPGTASSSITGGAGGFAGSSWTINIDAAGISTQPLTAKLATVTEAQAAEIAATCYHEGRHAEQLWLQARVMATQAKRDAATIATELDLLPATAKLAVDPALPKVPTSLLPQIAGWTALRSGRYKAFWRWNEDFRKFPGRVTVPLPDTAAIEKLSFADLVSLSAKIHRPVAGWEKDSFPPFVKVMKDADAIRGRNALDVKTIGDIHRINKAFTRLFKGEKAFADGLAALDQRVKDKDSGKRPFTAQQAAAMLRQSRAQGMETKLALIEITFATDDAYRNYPHEADSYRIGDLVTSGFQAANKAATAKTTPKTK